MLVGEDVAGWDENVVCADALPAVGEPEGVVECESCLVIGEAVEVPVCLFLLVLVLYFPSSRDFGIRYE